MLLITHQKTAMIELDCRVGKRQTIYKLTKLGRRIAVQVLEDVKMFVKYLKGL